MFFFEDKEYIPTNYEDTYFGMVTLRTALAKSLNVATVKVAEMVGFDKVAQAVVEEARDRRQGQAVPGGGARRLRGDAVRDGERLQRDRERRAQGAAGHDPERRRRQERGARAAPEPAARARAARGVGLPGDRHAEERDQGGHRGERRRARLHAPRPPARPAPPTTTATPGSSGFTPDLLCVVWVGFDDNTPVGLSGTRAALPIWVDFMKTALDGRPGERVPAGARGHRDRRDRQRHRACWRAPTAPGQRMEVFVAGTEPREPCGAH